MYKNTYPISLRLFFELGDPTSICEALCITKDFRTVLGHLTGQEGLFYFNNNNGLLA